MLTKKEILSLKKRRKIYHHILKYPGLYIRELSRDLNISFTTLNHHLNYLKKHDLLKAKSDERYTRYYVTGKVGSKDKNLLNVMRHTVPRNIILLFFLYPLRNFSQIEIVRFAKKWKTHWTKIGYHLNKHPTTIAYHLEKLLKMNIIESYTTGNETRYKLKDIDIIYNFLITYEKSFPGPVIGSILDWTSAWTDENYNIKFYI